MLSRVKLNKKNSYVQVENDRKTKPQLCVTRPLAKEKRKKKW